MTDPNIQPCESGLHAQHAEPCTAWTPPPPGDRREQLPDRILALIDVPAYLSTACQAAHACQRAADTNPAELPWLRAHAEELHARCRINNKFTGQLCVCLHHDQEAADA